MNMKQAGFTLIELVMVIVILGILAAVAVPKFVDLSSDAKIAAVKGVAGGVASGFAVNYAIRSANSAKGEAIAGAGVSAHGAAGSVLTGGVPTGFTVGTAAGVAGATSDAVSCTGAANTFALVIHDGTNSAGATLICTG